jgi:alkanesulfonate monooxygenase SsuD/methylene tetrahydromethanopterin reductase-like flavin-dependent oxidoreductase (luciferase family)
MDVGIGLPAMIPGVDRSSLLEWARQAEERGFSSLGTLDRLVYPNYEPLMSLAAAAAVTERIRLTTDVLLLPWRANYALVAKQTATLDSVSGGRLTLSVAMGRREDDYEASGVPMAESGRARRSGRPQCRRAGRSCSLAGPATPPFAARPSTATAGRWEAALPTS